VRRRFQRPGASKIMYEKKHATSPWITLAILSGLGIIAMSAETMVLPAIPDFILDLEISYQDPSWILAVILVTGAVMTPIAGKLSDIYGKKKVLLVILAVYILGLLIGPMATNFLSLVTARVLQGIGISMFPIAFSILRDKFPPNKESKNWTIAQQELGNYNKALC
jgi:MFS family permease